MLRNQIKVLTLASWGKHHNEAFISLKPQLITAFLGGDHRARQDSD